MASEMVVLLVEDDAAHRLMTRKALQIEGFATQETADGRQALDYVFGRPPYEDRAAHPPPDLILLDLNMPFTDGYEVLQSLREHEETRAIPVIVLSTSASQEEVERAYRLGANSYIIKPPNFDGFVEKARNIRLFWLSTATTPTWHD